MRLRSTISKAADTCLTRFLIGKICEATMAHYSIAKSILMLPPLNQW